MIAADVMGALTAGMTVPAWVCQAALIAHPRPDCYRHRGPYDTTAASLHPEVTVRVPTVKMARRTGQQYAGLQRRRLDLVALVLANYRQYIPVVAGVEIKVDKSDLVRDGKIGDYLPFCHLFYLATPAELRTEALAKLGELPGVGLLLVDGGRVAVEREPALRQPDDTRLKEMYAELLIRTLK